MIAGRSIREIIPGSLLLLLALALRALDLSGQSLWYDEAFSVQLARQHDIFTLIRLEAQLSLNTPLHYILLKGWMIGLGTSEFAARLLSVCAGVVSVALAHRLGSMILGRTSLAPTLLVALSPVVIMASRDVRMHGLASCLSLGATVAFLMAWRDDKPRLWLAWSVLGLLAFATHALSVTIVGTQIVVGLGLHLLQRRTMSRAQRVAMLATGAIIVIWASVLWSNRADYGVTYDASADWVALLVQTAAGQTLPRLLPAEWVIPVGVAVLVAIALSCAGLAWRGLAGALVGTTVLAIVVMATFCAIVGKFSPRYPAIIAPITTATIGIAVASTARHGRMAQVVGRLSLAALALGFAAGALALRIAPIYANEDFRGAVAYIRARMQPDERVLLVSGHFAPVFEYYWRGPTDAWIPLPPDPALDVRNTLTYTSVVPLTNAALAGMGGAWLLLWQDDVIDPTGVVPALLRRQSQAFAPQPGTPAFTGLRLQHYRFFRPYRPLPKQIPLGAATIEHNRPEVGLRSLGCVQPQPAYVGDGYMEVQCFWQTRPFVPLSVYTKVSLRLTDAQGNRIVQSDQPIAFNGFPYVPYEKPIWGVHFIPLPADLRADEYVMHIIPYTEAGEISPQVSLPIQVLAR